MDRNLYKALSYWQDKWSIEYEKVKELTMERDALQDLLCQALDALKNREHPCDICKGYDGKSCNYGYTEYCEGCMWYPWADENTCPNKWVWKEIG